MSTLTALNVAESGYQLGYGVNSSQAQPYDLYLATNTTAATITPLTSLLVINASGTMTAVTVNLPANVGEGTRLKIFTNQIITTLTLTPATSSQNTNGIADTVSSAVTTIGTANTSVEYAYRLTQASSTVGMPVVSTNLYTWYRIG